MRPCSPDGRRDEAPCFPPPALPPRYLSVGGHPTLYWSPIIGAGVYYLMVNNRRLVLSTVWKPPGDVTTLRPRLPWFKPGVSSIFPFHKLLCKKDGTCRVLQRCAVQ